MLDKLNLRTQFFCSLFWLISAGTPAHPFISLFLVLLISLSWWWTALTSPFKAPRSTLSHPHFSHPRSQIDGEPPLFSLLMSQINGELPTLPSPILPSPVPWVVHSRRHGGVPPNLCLNLEGKMVCMVRAGLQCLISAVGWTRSAWWCNFSWH
jgi:hypothetical protein